MCVSVPAKVCSVKGQVAEVETFGTRRSVFVTAENVKAGGWVLIYSGIAISSISESEAQEILRLWKKHSP